MQQKSRNISWMYGHKTKVEIRFSRKTHSCRCKKECLVQKAISNIHFLHKPSFKKCLGKRDLERKKLQKKVIKGKSNQNYTKIKK